ncbi:MAG: DEAD/DEAH box helicase [Nakamurella sp.]
MGLTAPLAAAPLAETSLSAPQQLVADRVIRALAGPDAKLRDDQLAAIDGLMQPGARVLVVQATGWGKSAVYWVATAIRRAEGAGPTLVISPLLSLMRDQVAAAERAGLRAATLNSSNIDSWSAIEADLQAGAIDVLLVSPERLANPGFGARVMGELSGALGLLVIDEAHAVSDWGHDFRPDYRRVADTLRRLAPDTPVLATTATANGRVTADVAAQLGEQTLVLRGPLARASLQLAVIDSLSPLQRFAWVVENLPNLPGSGIVYTLTVADANRLAAAITTFHGGAVKVAAYTGGLDPAERERLEDSLRANRIKALIATSALGMGYDKPDLGFCVHVGAPPSPVSYYQQVGRAGRGIDHAAVVLLSSAADARVWDYFATASIPDPDKVRRLLAVLPGPNGAAASIVALEAESGLRRTRVELMLKQLAVDGVTERATDGWRATGAEWVYDAAHYDGVVAVRQREADIMRDYARGRRCLMQLLQESLDDPTASPCGRCSVCTGTLPDALQGQPDVDVSRKVAQFLRGEQHRVEPRKMWPGGVFGTRGRIPASEQALVGRALIFADAPEWQELVASVFGGADREPPEDLVASVIRLLTDWKSDWPARPDVAVALPAAGMRVMTVGLVDRIASAGRLDVAELTVTGIPPADASSPVEAAHWASAIGVPNPEAVVGKTVLLVVDATSSLWPVTIAASKLLSAGVAAVLPLVVHRRP